MSETQPPTHDPYAPPRAVQVEAAVGDGSGGFWTNGSRLVMHRDARLPDHCVRCGEPAVTRLRKSLSWHHPAWVLLVFLGLLIYLIVALIIRKTMKAEIPLCARHHARRRLGLILAWGSCIMLFAGPVLLGALSGNGLDEDLFVVLLFGSELAFLATAVVGGYMATVVSPTKMDDTYAWLKVDKAFLARCPPLP